MRRPSEGFGIPAGSLPSDSKPALVTPAVIEFVRLGRPKFLIGGLLGGAVGTAIAAHARGRVDWGAYVLAQLTISALHAMTHYANDYYDRAGDARSVRTAYSGGSGVLVDGSIAPNVALTAAFALLAVGLAGASALALRGCGAAAVLALAIALLAWLYSWPPIRLLARGLGEIDVSVVVALLVPLCAYAAQAGWPAWPAVAPLLPGVGAMFAMMIGVEYPDVEADTACGKRNLVVRAGRTRAATLGYLALGAIAAGTALALVAGAPPALAVAILATLPWAAGYAVALHRQVWKRPGGDARIAARGVAVFVATTAAILVAYLVAPRYGP